MQTEGLKHYFSQQHDGLWRGLSVWATMLVLIMAMPPHATSATREYWIAAQEVLWDYAPSFTAGHPNPITGAPYTPEQRVFVADFIGSLYKKSLYRAYTPNFKAPVPHAEHLGTLGPVIRAEVGDTLIIHFHNKTRFPASMHPHGVRYTKANEGAPYADDTPDKAKADDAVPPGGHYTYTWEVPERAGPGPLDPSSIVWVYHSHVDEPADTNAGLIGLLVVTRQGAAKADGSPRDVEREFFSLFTVFDENTSLHFASNNRARFDPEDEAFQESNLMHGINGRLWGDNTGYRMRVGERVRWYILGMGTEVDLHTPHWHGVTVLHQGHRLDVAEILPAATKTFDLVVDNPGTWLFHCHVNDHIAAGMMTKLRIVP